MSGNPIAGTTVHLVPKPAVAQIEPAQKPKVRRDPAFKYVLLAACAVALQVALLLTGSLAAWVYYWLN